MAGRHRLFLAGRHRNANAARRRGVPLHKPDFAA